MPIESVLYDLSYVNMVLYSKTVPSFNDEEEDFEVSGDSAEAQSFLEQEDYE
jgi:hypothetical protein